MRIKSEEDLYCPILTDFNKKYEAYFEVYFHRRRVDIIFRGPDDLIAIEVKVRDWKKAIKQAAIYQLFADYSYIAMPHKFISKLDTKGVRSYFEITGIGLILINNDKPEAIIEAKRSMHIDWEDRNLIVKTLAAYSKENEIKPMELFNGEYRQQQRPPAFLPIGSII